MITRPRLAPGDAVALIAPAGPLASADDLALAVSRVESLGLRAIPGAHALARDGFLAGTDSERVADLNAAIRDPQIRGIFALRGGYGTMRLLDAIDCDALRADPKVLLGYSDLTAPLSAFITRSGVATYHGPMLAVSPCGAQEMSWLRSAVFGDPLDYVAVTPRTYVAGRAQGRLMGGNLSLLASLVGTPFAVDTAGAILVLEDIDESPYRVDRMLMQLEMSGALRGCAGIVLGTFAGCDEQTEDPQRRLERVFTERFGSLGIPVLAGAAIGHEGEQWTLPLGADAELNTEKGTLAIR